MYIAFLRNTLSEINNSLDENENQQRGELPECARYLQYVRDLNPCVREKLLMCGGAVVFASNVRDLVNLLN